MFKCCCSSSVRSYDLTVESADSAGRSFVCGNVGNVYETQETCWTRFSNGVWSLSRTLTSALCCCKKETPSLWESSDYLLEDPAAITSKSITPENKQEILQDLIGCADTANFHAKLGIFRVTPSLVQLRKALQDPKNFLMSVNQGDHNHILHAGVIKAMLREHCLTEDEKLYMVHMAGFSEQEITAAQPMTDASILALIENIPRITDNQFPEPLQPLFPLFRKIITAQLRLPSEERATALSLANSISGSLVPFTNDKVLTLKYSIVLAAVLIKAIENAPAVFSQGALFGSHHTVRESRCSSASLKSFDDYL